MNRTWHKIFVAMALLSPFLGLIAASMEVALFQDDIEVPYVSARFREMSDATIFLLSQAAAVGVALYFVVGWLISLDPNRPRRPRGWLVLLGLGPGWLIGAGAWLFLSVYGFQPAELLGIAVFVAIISSLLALVPDLLGSLATQALARTAERAKAWGMASRALQLRRRFVPNHPTLRRQIGLLDFRRGEFALAMPRLTAEYEAGSPGPRVLGALHESAHQLHEEELERRAGEDILQQNASRAAGVDEEKLRRRLTDIYARRKEWDEALRVFTPVVERTHPVDLEREADFLRLAGKWERLEEVLGELELAEAPPRLRLDRIFQTVVASLDEATLAIARKYAEYARRQKRQEEETRVLERILEVDSQDREARERLIKIYRNTILTDRLIRHLQWEVDHGEADVDVRVELADLLLTARELERADNLARDGAERAPEDYRFPYLRASVALQDGRFEDAHAQLDRALELAEKSDDKEGLETLRGLERKLGVGEAKHAIEELEAHCSEHPDDVEARLRLVDMLLRAKRAERATTQLESLVSAKPEARERVMEYLDEVIARDSPPYMLANYLADLNLREGRLDRAHELYGRMAELAFEKDQTLEEGARRILERSPDHLPSHIRLYELMAGRKKWREAGDYLKRAFELGWKPPDFESKTAAFHTLVEAGDLEHGRPLGEEVLEAEPFNARWQIEMGRLYNAADQPEEALRCLARAKELEPGNNVIFRMLDETRRKQRERRILTLREELNKHPEDADRMQELADLLVHFGRDEEALKLYQKASQTSDDENDRRLRYTKMAHVMMKRRMYDTCIEALRDVPLSLMEEKAALAERKRIFYEVAEEMESNNRMGDALELYKQVFKVDAGFRHVMEKVERLGT